MPSAPGQEQDIAEEFGLESPRRLHVLDEHVEQRSDDGTGGGVEVAAELGGQKRRNLQQRAADLVLDDGDHPAGAQPVDHSLGVADAEPAEEVVGDGGQSLQRGRLGHGAELGENRCRRLVAGAERQRHTWTQFDDPIGEGRRIRIDGDPGIGRGPEHRLREASTAGAGRPESAAQIGIDGIRIEEPELGREVFEAATGVPHPAVGVRAHGHQSSTSADQARVAFIDEHVDSS